MCFDAHQPFFTEGSYFLNNQLAAIDIFICNEKVVLQLIKNTINNAQTPPFYPISPRFQANSSAKRTFKPGCVGFGQFHRGDANVQPRVTRFSILASQRQKREKFPTNPFRMAYIFQKTKRFQGIGLFDRSIYRQLQRRATGA